MQIYPETNFKEITAFVADSFLLHKIIYEKRRGSYQIMNTWILLLLLCCCDGFGSQRNGSCGNNRPDMDCDCGNIRDRDCDCDRDRDCDRGNGRDRDCDCDRDRGRDRNCDGNDSRFEPRFDARPFGGGDNCGCDA